MIYIRSKFAPKHKDKLVHKNDIQEKMVLIEGSDTDYITPSGIVYADYDNNMFYMHMKINIIIICILMYDFLMVR